MRLNQKLTYAVIAGGLLLSGCMHSGYPNDWASLSSNTDCANISGTYKQEGESAAKSRQSDALLSRLLDPNKDSGIAFYEHGDVQDVSIVQTDGKLKIDATLNSEVIASWTLDSGDGGLSCDEGQWIYYSETDFFGDEPQAMAMGVGRGTARISKIEDGTLIVEIRSFVAGTAILVIPMAASERVYYRFYPLEDVG